MLDQVTPLRWGSLAWAVFGYFIFSCLMIALGLLLPSGIVASFVVFAVALYLLTAFDGPGETQLLRSYGEDLRLGNKALPQNVERSVAKFAYKNSHLAFRLGCVSTGCTAIFFWIGGTSQDDVLNSSLIRCGWLMLLMTPHIAWLIALMIGNVRWMALRRIFLLSQLKS